MWLAAFSQGGHSLLRDPSGEVDPPTPGGCPCRLGPSPQDSEHVWVAPECELRLPAFLLSGALLCLAFCVRSVPEIRPCGMGKWPFAALATAQIPQVSFILLLRGL